MRYICDIIRLMKRTVKLLIAAAAFTALWITAKLLAGNEAVSEAVAGTASRGLITAVGAMTSVLPFSLFEFFFYAVIIGGVTVLVKIIKSFVKRDWRRGLRLISETLCAVFCVLFIYSVTASFAYGRKEIDFMLPEFTMDETLAYDAAAYYTDGLAELANGMERDGKGNVISPYTFKELNAKLKEEYKRLDNNPYFSRFTPRAKKPLASPFLAALDIGGFFFAPIGEANVSGVAAAYDLPFTAAHEMAHAKGAMREFDANLTAYYILMTSDDPFLRYSGYMCGISYMLDAVYYSSPESRDELRAQIPPAVFTEYKNAHELYARYNSFVTDISDWFNDMYLKFNGQKDGTDSYLDFGDVEIIPVEPTEPNEEPPPPIRVPQYSQTQKVMAGIYLMKYPSP